MNEKRELEAKNNVKQYLDDGLVIKQPYDKIIFNTYMKNIMNRF